MTTDTTRADWIDDERDTGAAPGDGTRPDGAAPGAGRDEAAPRRAVGPVWPPFEGVRRIAVLRGGGLGDVLFAEPALRALAAAYPGAEITLLGTPLHRELFEGRPGPVDRVEVLPFAEGVRPGPEDADATGRFLDRMRARRFDLAVQVHGGGRYSNPFLLGLGARHTVGTRTPDAAELERTLGYHYYQHEVLRALEVAGLAGAVTDWLEPRFGLTPADLAEADALLADLGAGGEDPLLVVHAGASDERRRWSPARFADLALRAAADGYRVLLVGDPSEAGLADGVARRAGHPRVVSVAGRLGLGGLAGLFARAAVVVGNDSGPRHLAQAVGTPTVGIYWVGNLIMASPLGRAEHRVHLGWVTHCPECGTDVTQVGWTAPRCDHVFPLVDQVDPADVYADVVDLTATSPRPSGR